MTAGMAAWYDNEVEEYSSETLLNDDMVAGGQWDETGGLRTTGDCVTHGAIAPRRPENWG